MRNLVGKNILIVDEVDDTRTTLEYAVRELRKDVEAARQRLLADEGEEHHAGETQFCIFVLHVSLVSLGGKEQDKNKSPIHCNGERGGQKKKTYWWKRWLTPHARTKPSPKKVPCRRT